MAESSTGRHDEAARGIARGLTHYGDPDFSLFIRGAYARGAGLTAEPLLRPPPPAAGPSAPPRRAALCLAAARFLE